MTRLLAVAVALVLAAAACSDADSTSSSVPPAPTAGPTTSETTTTAPPGTAAPTTAPPTTATAAPPTTRPPTTAVAPVPDAPPEAFRYEHYVRTENVTPGVDIDIHAPAEVGPWPVVVTVHGGGWFAGNRDAMGPLADGLADRKIVVINTGYRTISRGGSFPGMVDDIACAVQRARTVAPEFSTAPTSLTIVGHSAGAHLASLVAYAPDQFGRGCPDGPMQAPDAFVGLAGPYDTDQLAALLPAMFGGSIRDVPDAWAAGNPYTWIDASPAIPTLLLHGEDDQIAPIGFSEDLFIALTEAGRDVTFETLFERGHSEASSPRVVGDRIAAFVSGRG